MFSETSEYALRVVVFLASRDTPPATTRQIARATHVPAGYLAKVLQNLGRMGFVKSQRGLHGGFVLGHRPADITVYDVVKAVDSVPRIRSCPLGLKNHGGKLCPLHHRLDKAMATVEEAFRQSTIADVLADPSPNKPLCEASV